MRPGQIIVLATPVFFLLIAIEFAVGRMRARCGTGQDTYRLADAVNSIGLMARDRPAHRSRKRR